MPLESGWAHLYEVAKLLPPEAIEQLNQAAVWFHESRYSTWAGPSDTALHRDGEFTGIRSILQALTVRVK